MSGGLNSPTRPIRATSSAIRVGIQIIPDDTFWVEVNLTLEQQARQAEIELIPVDVEAIERPNTDWTSLIEEIIALELEAFIVLEIPHPLLTLILAQNIPVISLVAQVGCHGQHCYHPGIVAPLGLYKIAQIMSNFVAEQLQGQGNLLVVGGLRGVGDDGQTLLAGINDTVTTYPGLKVEHIPTAWPYDVAFPQILAGLEHLKTTPDAIIGLSDTLALAGRAAAEQRGLLKPKMLVVGHNGDAQALKAIVHGEMTATVQVSTVDFVKQVIDIVLELAAGQPLPSHFYYNPALITSNNVAEAAVQKLLAISELPSRLVGVNRRREQQHLTQLEASFTINRQVGAVLDRATLTHTIVNTIRTNFNYSRVNLYVWSEDDKFFWLDDADPQRATQVKVGQAESSVLAKVLETGELVYIPDLHNSPRFRPDPTWPLLRSRVALPVRFGDKILCVLDLQCDYLNHHSREQLLGLQLLANQLAIAVRNAELYTEAVAARHQAEKADKLKTLLLANVSHEFRTPLNIILGYSKEALNVPNPYGTELPFELRTDLSRIYRSGEHLMRLINDLLDLSRAEIDELDIFPQVLNIRPILEEVFQSVAALTPEQAAIAWQFDVPTELPVMQVDPLRLRQILLNLLSNARKFTRQGQVVLGGQLEPPYLHIWVKDTGSGIVPDQQDLIFEPFMVGEKSDRPAGGVGLGLSITRHLVTLHRGYITLESQPGVGSTFHVYLPLPNLSGKLLALASPSQPNLVCISNRADLPPEIERLREQPNICFYKLQPAEVRTALLALQPSIIAWDVANVFVNDWSALDYLRETPQLARLPLVLYGNQENENNQSGITNVLLKPLSAQTLSTMLEALGPKQSRSEVLIVDDDLETLDLYEKLVQTALPGCSIRRVNSGSGAIKFLKQTVPSLVIIDLLMPEVDGYEVVKWLRSNPQTQNVPVLVVSGKVLSAESIERLDYPRLVFQTKDILYTDEISNTVRQIMDGTPLLSQFNSILVKRTVAFLHDNYTRPISLNEIAQAVGISKNYLSEIFHQEMRVSAWEYLTRYRIKQAKHLLKSSDLTVANIAAKVGFEDPAYFSRVFHTHSGQSPKAYRLAATS